MSNLPKLDPIFHQVVRTRLAVLLHRKPHSFSQLKTALIITDGNLDAHLRRLSSAGYLHSQMLSDGKRPQTIYRLSDSGTEAFENYLSDLNFLVNFSLQN